MKRTLLLILMIAALLTSGCMGGMISNPKSKDASLVYGFIDLKGGSTRGLVRDVELTSVDEDKPATYYSGSIKFGLFFFSSIPPGSYMLTSFEGHGSTVLGYDYRYNLPPYSQSDYKLKIKKPGIYYMGSHKFNKAGKKSFTLKRVKTPTEKQLLEWLLEEAIGTKWEPKIRARLKQLK